MPGFAYDFVFFAFSYASLIGIVLFRQFHQNSVVTSHSIDQSAPWGRYPDAVVEAPSADSRQLLHAADADRS